MCHDWSPHVCGSVASVTMTSAITHAYYMLEPSHSIMSILCPPLPGLKYDAVEGSTPAQSPAI